MNDIMDIIYEELGILDEDDSIDLNISPEYINEICNKFKSNNILNEDMNILLEKKEEKVKKSLSNFIDKESSDKIFKNSKSAASNIANTIKTKGINEESRKTISGIFNKFIDDTIITITKTINIPNDINKKLEEKGCTEAEKIAKALVYLLLNVIINIVFKIVLRLLLGPLVSNVIVACIVAPLSEEFFKRIAVRDKVEVEFTILFNAYEFSSYTYLFINKMKSLGFKISKNIVSYIVKIRLKTVTMHLVNTLIHWMSENETIHKLLKMENDPDKQEKFKFIAHIIAVLIHASWNTLVTISEYKPDNVAGQKFTDLIQGKQKYLYAKHNTGITVKIPVRK